MKHLYLVRHAKAAQADGSVADLDRPLNRRGLADAPHMAARLAARQEAPQQVLSSPARRTLETARLFAAAWRLPPSCITKRPEIYEADAGDLLALLRTFPPDWARVLVCGHNPAMTDLLNVLTDEMVENLPTCGVAVIRFEADTWTGTAIGEGHLVSFDMPRGGG